MAKQNYTIDKVKKIITATITDLDAVEKEIVQMYINAGYILHKGKSNPWNKKRMEKWLDDNATEKDKKTFKTMCEDTNVGWVKARAWFFELKKEIEEKKAKEEEKAKAKAEKEKEE